MTSAVVLPDVETIGQIRRGERDLHWSMARAFMDERGLDALIAFGTDRFGADTFLTNDQPSMTVVFPRNGEMVGTSPFGPLRRTTHFIGRERGEDSWLDDVRTMRSGEVLVGILREKGLTTAKIGVIGLGSGESDGWIPYRTWRTVEDGVPDATLVDVTWPFAMLLLARTPGDVACLRESARIGEMGCQAMIEVTRVGATEAEFLAAMAEVFAAHGARTPMTMLSSGPDNFAWGPPIWMARPQPSRAFDVGDVVQAELFPTFGDLESQQQIAVAVGSPHHEATRCADVARRSYDAGLAVLRPGITFADLVDAMEAEVAEADGWHLTPLVHTLNPLIAHGPTMPAEDHVDAMRGRYVTEPARGGARRDWEIRPGMAFAFEPNCCLGRYRVNIGGTVLVTDSGVEELNDVCNRLVVVPA